MLTFLLQDETFAHFISFHFISFLSSLIFTSPSPFIFLNLVSRLQPQLPRTEFYHTRKITFMTNLSDLELTLNHLA